MSRRKALRRIVRRARWGNLRRLEPLSDKFGFDRGTPIDRFYMEQFFEAHATDVRGCVLEVGEPTYTRRYGGSVVTTSEVVDIRDDNARATLVADLAVPGSLPEEHYDCVLLVQTLQYVTDVPVALGNVWRSLRPGGVLLTCVPGLARHDLHATLESDRWRFTPAGLTTLLRATANDAEHAVTGYGNLLSTVAFLYGLAAEELRPRELEPVDPSFPVVAVARSAKAPR